MLFSARSRSGQPIYEKRSVAEARKDGSGTDLVSNPLRGVSVNPQVELNPN